MLDYERLDVYRLSLNFLAVASRLIEVLPRGHSSLADQLRRAAMSVPLNIAEASGKSSAERAQYHRIARGSAMECGAILDVARILDVVPAEDFEMGMQLLERVVSMLSRMSR